MEVASQFRSADFREDAEGEADDIIVISVQVDSDSVGCHHEEL
jgi:hypothetical protein